MDLRLQDGESMKFARPRGETNPITARTVPPDDVIGEIINSNQVFIPIAVGPFGGLGSLFCRFIEDVNTLPLPSFPTDRPNTARAAKLATNHQTAYNVLGKADQKWKATKPSKCFDGSYLSQLPSTWAHQKLGLPATTHLANHINNSLTKLTFCRGSVTQPDGPDSDFEDDDCWRFFDGLMEEQFNQQENSTSHFPGTDGPPFFGSLLPIGRRGVT
jgi:hypothetical protein